MFKIAVARSATPQPEVIRDSQSDFFLSTFAAIDDFKVSGHAEIDGR